MKRLWIFFLALIFLLSASCLFKSPELTPVVNPEDVFQKKIQEALFLPFSLFLILFLISSFNPRKLKIFLVLLL